MDEDDGYQDGWQDGHDEGEAEGYEEGKLEGKADRDRWSSIAGELAVVLRPLMAYAFTDRRLPQWDGDYVERVHAALARFEGGE